MPTVTPNYAAPIEAFTRGFMDAQAQAAARDRQAATILYEGAKQNPALFDSPIVRKQVKNLVGGDDVYDLVAGAWKSANDPESAAYQTMKQLGILEPGEEVTPESRALAAVGPAAPGTPQRTAEGGVVNSIARALGLGGDAQALPIETAQAAPAPFAGSTEKLMQRATRIPGSSTKIGPKGVEVTIKGKTVEQNDAARLYKAIGIRQRELQESGLDYVPALQQATTEAVNAAEQAGILVPEQARTLAQTEIKLATDKRIKEMQKNVDMQFAAPIAFRESSGRREAEIETPKTAEERITRDVSNIQDPTTGEYLSPAAQTKEVNARLAAFEEEQAFAKGKGGGRARLVEKAVEDIDSLTSVSGSLKTFVPVAAKALTSETFKAKFGLQALRLYFESGKGSPPIAGLNVLRTQVARFTKVIGEDVGNLAAQEQEPVRRVIDGTWQTAQEFVVGTMVMGLAAERLAAVKAQRAGVEHTPGSTYRDVKAVIAKSPELANNPEMKAALDNFEVTFGLREDTRTLDDIYGAYGYGAAPAAPAGTPTP